MDGCNILSIVFCIFVIMGNTNQGRIKQFCKKEGIDVDFYNKQILNGFKWCFKCSSWKIKEQFATDNSRYDNKKSACYDCLRVKVKVDTKGRPSSFKGKNHNEDAKNKMRVKNAGKSNPNWKGGITGLITQIRNTAQYKEWRLKIYYDSKFTCSKCKIKKVGKNIILDADHIIALAKIVFDNNIKTIEEALKCEKIFDVKNGRSLCRTCHKETNTWGVNVNKKLKNN